MVVASGQACSEWISLPTATLTLHLRCKPRTLLPGACCLQRGAGGETSRGALRAVDAASASASDDSWGSVYGSEQAFCDLSTITPPAHIMRKLALSIKRMSL